jgi:hypothetical protein
MCDSVIFGDREFGTPRKLAELIGGEDKLIWQKTNPFVNWPEGKDWHDLDLCLCPIDLTATLEKAGFNWRRGKDPMEYFVERSSQSSS